MTSSGSPLLSSVLAVCTALGLVVGSSLGAQLPGPSQAARARWQSLDRHAPPLEPGLWAHRGWHGDGAAENSAEAVLAAVDRGFAGVELDVWWLEGTLRVGHERNKARAGPALAAVVAGTSVSLWLDLKNLAEAQLSQLAPVLQRLCAGRACWVESQDAEALVLLSSALPEVGTIRWSVFPPRLVELYGWPVGIDAMSVPVRRLDTALVAAASPLPVFTFTVDRLERARELREEGVAIVLTDELLPGEVP